jgi:hypothetical protein
MFDGVEFQSAGNQAHVRVFVVRRRDLFAAPNEMRGAGRAGSRLDNTVAWPACPESGRRGETVRSVVRPRSLFPLLNTLAAAADLPLGAPAARPVCS